MAMEPYQIESGSAELVEQQDGMWIAEFNASVYNGQSVTQTSNSINPNNVRVIQFDVSGSETAPLAFRGAASSPYTRGSETGVELELYRDGKKKGHTSVGYP